MRPIILESNGKKPLGTECKSRHYAVGQVSEFFLLQLLLKTLGEKLLGGI